MGLQHDNLRNIETEILSDAWYTLKKISFDYRREDGAWERQSREAYDRGNGAAILLYNAEKGTVVLTRQFRMPTFINGNRNGMMIEVCAGLLDGDAPEACIRKEALEETGYRVGEVIKVFEAYMSPGAVTEILHFYIGSYTEDDKMSAGGGLEEESEDIEILEIPFGEALLMIGTGAIRDAKTIMLLQYAQIQKLMV